MKQKKKYVIKWIGDSGSEGSGEALKITKADAEKIATEMDKAFPNLRHWVEEAE